MKLFITIKKIKNDNISIVKKPAYNKYNWSKKEIDFIKDNFFQLTNRKLAAALGLKLTSVRTKCYELGLKRIDLEYWTAEQVSFLKEHYKTIGDAELSEMFSARWAKDKGWTKKHIEKKRRQMGLKRTQEEMNAIHLRNKQSGRWALCPVNAWKKRGVTPEGTIKYWKKSGTGIMYPVIKINGRFLHWNRWAWEKTHGPVPVGANIIFKDGNPCNLDINNLELLSNPENMKRNNRLSSKGLSDNYVAGIMSFKRPDIREHIKNSPKLIDLKRKQLILNRTIYAKEVHKKAGRNGG